MDPLKRNNPGVRATDHENRIQTLERRIFPQATAWAMAILSTDQTIGAGSSAFLEFDNFYTGQPTLFDTDTGAAGYTAVECAEFGVYHAQCVVEWEQIASDYYHAIQLQAGRQFGSQFSDFSTSTASASTVRLDNTVGNLINLSLVDSSLAVHSPWDYTESQPATWKILALNPGGIAVDVTRANLFVALLPSDEADVDYQQF